MRKFVTAVAAALTLGFAAPAFADHNDNGNYPYQGQYNQNQGQYNQHQGQPGYDNDDYRYPQDGRADRRHYDRYDFDRHNGQFDRWQHGWNDYGYNQYRNHRPLNFRQLTPRLAAQGFYGVRKVAKDRRGSYRAYAFNQRGRPVMLRINAYTGRVLDVRYL
jgi:hypothetical protein